MHTAVKYLGIWSLAQSILVFMESIRLLYNGVWWGMHLALFNGVYIMQSYWYYKWYKRDDFDTRRNLLKGYKYVLIQSVVLYTFLFAVIYYLPSSYLPDQYEDNMGNTYDFPPEQKEDMKDFALYFIAIFGFINVSFQYYLFRVVRKWADKNTLIQHSKTKRLSMLSKSNRSTFAIRQSGH